MMVMDVLGWLLLILVCWVTLKLFRQFVEMRLTANKMMAIASKGFFVNADRLMNSADELPNRVLEILDTMNRYANHSNSQRALLAAVKLKENPQTIGDELYNRTRELECVINEMRPELRKLLEKTIVTWLLYISNRSVLTQIRMIFLILPAHSQGIQYPEEHLGYLVNALLESKPE